MNRPLILAVSAAALLLTGCCKILNCCTPCPTPVPCPRTSDCGSEPRVPAFTGGNEPGLDVSTSISASDIAVVAERTNVTYQEDGSWHLHTEIAVDHGNNSTALDDTHALILLPPDCQVVSVEAMNTDSSEASWTQCKAYVRIDLAQLNPGPVIDSVAHLGHAARIDVRLERSPYTSADGQPAFAVIAFSGRPDMRPDNNYWWWKNKHGRGLQGDPADSASWFPPKRPEPARPPID